MTEVSLQKRYVATPPIAQPWRLIKNSSRLPIDLRFTPGDAMTMSTIPPRSLPRLLTPGEAADFLRTSRKAIYAMIERGQLPGVVRSGDACWFERMLC